MARNYDHVISFALDSPWAVTPSMLTVIAGLLARRIAGEDPDTDAIAAALVARSNRVSGAAGTLRADAASTVIPIFGVIAPRMNLLSEMSGGTTFETLTAQVRAAVADPRITQIIFDVDSPGGNAAGATEFAKEVVKARASKRVIAVANHSMCSAAYWAMSGATEIVATPSSMVGSIGVYAIHNDISNALAQMGIKRSVISAGKYKAEGADGGALTAEAEAHVQALINSCYGRFIASVSTGRGVPALAVRSGYGEGHVLDAEAALAAHLVDRIATLDDVLGQVDTRAADAAMAAHGRVLAQAALSMHQNTLDAIAARRRVQ